MQFLPACPDHPGPAAVGAEGVRLAALGLEGAGRGPGGALGLKDAKHHRAALMTGSGAVVFGLKDAKH